jgi:hypothetical protein
MGTEKQEKHMVSIIFLFTSERHEAVWEPWILFFLMSGFLIRPDTKSHRHSLVWDFCLSSLELSHKARCQITQAQSGFEAFASVSWSFLTRPDINSYRQGPTASSDTEICWIPKHWWFLTGHFHFWSLLPDQVVGWKLQGFHMPGPAVQPKCKMKRYGEGREGTLLRELAN